MDKKIVTRFAPSPTGYMHIGGVRTALFAYLFARKNNGTFILRIEDTDKEREVEGSIQHIQDSLSWLSIDWDYGPDKLGPFGSCIQSQRLDTYTAYAHKLIEKGLAYPDPYTLEELEAFRIEATEAKRPFLFREHRPETFAQWDGTKPLRLKVPEVKRYTWNDAVRGELTAGEEALDDIILIKADGYPTYNFAHIIDDLNMGVTHIMRGDEFISSTPKFLSIYDALEIPYPIFVTLPPIMGPDGKKKLGKRDGAKDLLEYKKEGYLADAMSNFLALIGWNPGTEQEIFSRNELIQGFSIEKIQRSGGAFNEEKLRWMNKHYLGLLNHDEQYIYLEDVLKETSSDLPQYSEERIAGLVPIVFERIHTKVDIRDAAERGEYDWAFTTPQYDSALLLWKNDTTINDALPRLLKAIEILETSTFQTLADFQPALMKYAEEVGKGELLWPLRVALSGKKQSPDPFSIALTLGKEETIKRIKTACAKISS